jgi:RNA polymerase sigma-70 factor (ECF subfamily)
MEGGEACDELWVSKIVSGEKELFRPLLKRYEKQVYGMGFSFLHSANDAADFSQEVFLKVYKNLGSFEGRSRFSTWLYKIAYNTAVNKVNRRKEYLTLAEGSSAGEASGDFGESGDVGGAALWAHTPERELIRNAVREGVREAVRGLPERYRICIDLAFFYERSYEEIEGITGFPLNTIKSHVFRGKKILREKLACFEGELC